MVRIPEVGEKIKFFDDGKTSLARRNWAIVTEVLPFNEARKNARYYKDWLINKKENKFLYAKETDYFVFADVLGYDNDVSVFVRTVDGRWFSIDSPHWWMSGLLDVDDKLWNEIKGDNEIFI